MNLSWLPRSLDTSEAGQDSAEYAIMLGFVALAIAVGIGLLGSSLAAVWMAIVTAWIRVFP